MKILSRQEMEKLPTKRFILRYRGEGKPSASDIQHIQSFAKLIDRMSQMLLIEVEVDSEERLFQELTGWIISEETQVSLPDARHRVLNQ